MSRVITILTPYQALHAGELRDRITIQKRVYSQDAVTGEQTVTWQDWLVNEPANIEPVSVRDFIASQANQSQIVARIKIRYRDGLDPTMRVLNDGAIYNPMGWLPDGNSGREWLTAPCTLGVNEGQ